MENFENFIRKSYKDRESWLSARVNSIGASEAASVLGLSPWKSNVELWEEKTLRRKQKDLSSIPAVQRGIAEEPKIREQFIREHPEFIVDYNEFDILHHRDLSFITATLDGEIYELEKGRHGVLEIKTGSYSSKKYLDAWSQGKIPDHYFPQVVQQLLVTGWDFAILRAKLFRVDKTYRDGSTNGYLPESYETMFYVDAQDPVVQESMGAVKDGCVEFWGCVVGDKMPWTVISNTRI
jgi:putative phage-type endonuclease